MKAHNARARCWVTGVDLALDEARVLDARRAVEIRKDLVQRLTLIDRLLSDFGPRAGECERASEIDVPPHAFRSVSPPLKTRQSR